MARTLLYQRSNGGARTSVLEVDVVLRESPSLEATPTDSPVEDGADVTDHIIRKSPSWEVEGVVSDTPMEGPAQPGRGLAAWQTLQRLAESGGLLVLATQRGDEVDVVLTSARETRDVRTSGVCAFTASFRRIRTVATAFVSLPKRAASKASGKKDNGKQGAKDADGTTSGRAKSILLGDILQPLGVLK